MAGSRPSVTSRRRAERAHEERRQRLIVLVGFGVLGLVAVIIAVGLYLTQYRAPRQHVLSAGDRDYTAAAVARRASYHALFESGTATSLDDIAQRAVELLIEQQVVRERAPLLVGPVTEEDVRAELRVRFGIDPPPAPAGGSKGAAGPEDATATPEAPTATPAATAEAGQNDEAVYADALGNVLRVTELHQQEYFDLVTSQMLTLRLRAHFGEAIGETAEQWRLARIRLADRAKAEQVRELALAAADPSGVVTAEAFAGLVREHTVDIEHREDGGDLGWQTREQLDTAVMEAVEGLAAGEVAPIVESGIFFDLYLVAERDAAQPIGALQREQIITRRVAEWLEGERPNVEVQRDLSQAEERWIVGRVADDIADARRR